jgi:hypothetical protein
MSGYHVKINMGANCDGEPVHYASRNAKIVRKEDYATRRKYLLIDKDHQTSVKWFANRENNEMEDTKVFQLHKNCIVRLAIERCPALKEHVAVLVPIPKSYIIQMYSINDKN